MRGSPGHWYRRPGFSLDSSDSGSDAENLAFSPSASTNTSLMMRITSGSNAEVGVVAAVAVVEVVVVEALESLDAAAGPLHLVVTWLRGSCACQI